jgi:hypothetical protein
MQPLRFELTLTHSPDDKSLFSVEYQTGLRQFYSQTRSEGTRITKLGYVKADDTAHSDGGFAGSFLVSMNQIGGANMRIAAKTWLEAKHGRKIWLTIGSNKLSASDSTEFNSLAERAAVSNPLQSDLTR